MSDNYDSETGEVREVPDINFSHQVRFPVDSSPQLDKLYAALVQAQRSARAVGKDKQNKFHGYKYASAESVIDEARTALSDAGLAFLTLRWGLTGQRTDRTVGRVSVDYRLVHASGQYLNLYASTPVIPEKGRPEDKAELAALTANLSYMLRGLLLLPRDADTDASIDERDDRGHPQPVRVTAPTYDTQHPSRSQPQEEPPPGDDTPEAAAASDGPGPSGDRAVDLVDRYIERIRALEAQFGLAEKKEREDVLRELERLPPKVKELTLPEDEVKRLIAVYNPTVTSMRKELGLTKESTP